MDWVESDRFILQVNWTFQFSNPIQNSQIRVIILLKFYFFESVKVFGILSKSMLE